MEDTEIELFDDSSDSDIMPARGQAWNILIVDDDTEVHRATAYSIKDITIFGRRLSLIFASSAREALEKTAGLNELAVAIIDVVMETPDAGLELVKALRERGFHDTRLILRTGFPGYAPEVSVVTNYEIDGYFTKEELTRTRLISLLTTAIRAYENIRIMSRSREGLELIVGSARQLYKRNDLEMFAQGVLTQVAALLRMSSSGLVSGSRSENDKMRVITGIGRFAGHQGKTLEEVDETLAAMCANSRATEDPFNEGDYLGMRFESDLGALLFAALESDHDVTPTELDLLRIFSSNISVGFENISLLEALNKRAFTDPILDLPNLNAFEDALNEALDRGPEGYIAKVQVCDYQSQVATFGTIVTRKLMRQAYNRLTAMAGDSCQVALVGEGAFGIVDPNATLLPEKLAEALQCSYIIDDIEMASSPSSIILQIRDLPENRDDALTVATAAQVPTRNAEGEAHVLYGKRERLAWERRNRLRNALKRDSETFSGLATYLQPKVDLMTGDIIGAEALLRWTNDDEAIPPSEFIPIAEATGLTRSLTNFVLRDVAAWVKANARPDGQPFRVSVNLSMADLNVPGFAAWLLRRLQALGLQPPMIDFEVTEAIAMSGEVPIEQARELAKQGYSISLDDFGTGYSSLAHLERLPFQTVKIDRSFVSHLTGANATKSLCTVIVAMTDLLGMDCVAEGIETEEQRDALSEMGCRFGQGFLFGRPVPMADFSEVFALVPQSGGNVADGTAQNSEA